ncbi:hypothetical protein BC833DRAFT_579122 [Globomyces pollinis-pini]|nr:hypothetical protein BC833DRAFT_579122 [Globomyces pollinis-pini]
MSLLLFALPKDVLGSIQCDATVEPESIEEPILKPTQIVHCNLCKIKETQRYHFSTDWHHYNAKRILKSLTPISLQEFEDKEDLSSIEGSEDEEVEVENNGSPFAKFQLNNEKYAGKELCVYKQVLSPKTRLKVNWNDKLLDLQIKSSDIKTWTLFMLASGHFSGAVINCNTGKAIVHKTFHRYTTRRKQGGAQSGNDSSKGNAHSAGAGIRRYNEQALREEIQALMIEWKDHLKQSSLIFIRAPPTTRKTLFFDPNILDSSDLRVRSFPFITNRPTLTELMRCYEELIVVKIQDIQVVDKSEKGKRKRAPSAPAPQTHLQIEIEAGKDAPVNEELNRIIDAIKKGKVELLDTLLKKSSAEEDISLNSVKEKINQVLTDKIGISLLHIASGAGQPDVIKYLLENGADPTIQGEHKSSKPYDLAISKDARDTFRRHMAKYPDQWDYKLANVPGPLTEEMEEKQRSKERERRKKEKERKKLQGQALKENIEAEPIPDPSITSTTKKFAFIKLDRNTKESIGMTPEQRQRLDREKRAMAAESRIRSTKNECGACGKSLAGLESFDKSIYRYCSMECLKVILVQSLNFALVTRNYLYLIQIL